MSLSPVTTISGVAAHLLHPHLDTDIIIRIDRLTALARDELGPYAFEVLRRQADGAEDPGFFMNQPVFRGAPILLASENFGCGSSREAAVWALQGIGVRCIIAPSFGDIFYTNCFQNGMLAICLPVEQMDILVAACAGGRPLTVDLTRQRLQNDLGLCIDFPIDPVRLERLLHGLDDIDITLKSDALVRSWQGEDRRARPWAWFRPSTFHVDEDIADGL